MRGPAVPGMPRDLCTKAPTARRKRREWLQKMERRKEVIKSLMNDSKYLPRRLLGGTHFRACFLGSLGDLVIYTTRWHLAERNINGFIKNNENNANGNPQTFQRYSTLTKTCSPSFTTEVNFKFAILQFLHVSFKFENRTLQILYLFIYLFFINHFLNSFISI